MAQEYYANKYGIQLEEFLIWRSEWDLKFWQYNFTTGQGFALTNALKYAVRAGKKPNEPYEKDMGKYNDYINMAVKMGFERSEAEDWVALQKSIFEEFKGRKVEVGDTEKYENILEAFGLSGYTKEVHLWLLLNRDKWEVAKDELFYICIPEPGNVNAWLPKDGGVHFYAQPPINNRYKWTQEEIAKHEVAKHLQHFKKKVEE